jgi:hypothetical protein
MQRFQRNSERRDHPPHPMNLENKRPLTPAQWLPKPATGQLPSTTLALRALWYPPSEGAEREKKDASTGLDRSLISWFSLRAPESGRGLPQSKTLRDQRAAVPFSARSWTAPALWRFGSGLLLLGGKSPRFFPLIIAYYRLLSPVIAWREKNYSWQSRKQPLRNHPLGRPTRNGRQTPFVIKYAKHHSLSAGQSGAVH